MSTLRGHHLVQALESVSLPVLLLDPTGAIGWSNTAAAALLGAAPGVLAGQPLVRFVRPADQARVRRALAGLERGEAGAQDLPCAVGSDPWTATTLRLAPVRASDLVVGVLALCQPLPGPEA